ncbi:MAG: MBL fold metallo-hydrolase, partial [Deltaproteobacteria bacterium]|nr:MBL fold metallo-hydrolase [Deltaproteobacteria bacterium]
MKITFWGTRGSTPTPGKNTTLYGGNTTCLEVDLESKRKIIIDAGTGLRPLGTKLIAESEKVDIFLLMTHVHWDHIWGFPFFEPLYNPSTKISIDGCQTCISGLISTFDHRVMDGVFPVAFKDVPADLRYFEVLKEEALYIDDVVIDAINLHHPQGGFAYRLEENGKSLVFMTDNEITAGNLPPEQIEFCRGADILIHDAQYTPEEMDLRKGWGHSDYATALDLAEKAEAKRLILTHHDPKR